MSPLLEKTAAAMAKLPVEEREDLERYFHATVQARIAELDAETDRRDAETAQGLKELEEQDFIPLDEARAILAARRDKRRAQSAEG